MSGQSWNFLDKAGAAFAGADLPTPNICLQTLVASQQHVWEWVAAVYDIVESLLPAMVRLNVATAEEVDLPTLRDRLMEEATTSRSLIVGRSEVGIWVRVP